MSACHVLSITSSSTIRANKFLNLLLAKFPTTTKSMNASEDAKYALIFISAPLARQHIHWWIRSANHALKDAKPVIRVNAHLALLVTIWPFQAVRSVVKDAYNVIALAVLIAAKIIMAAMASASSVESSAEGAMNSDA